MCGCRSRRAGGHIAFRTTGCGSHSNVFTQRYDLHELRYSTGLALFWSSPFGPLKLSFAQPLNAQSTDHIQRIQFTFGTGF